MRLLENYGYSGTSSVKGRTNSIVSVIHGEMADVLQAFERNSITGFRHSKPAETDLVREILGQPTGKPEVKAMADAVTGAFDRLRERFNAAGGEIGELKGGYIPQWHDPRALQAAGFDAWKAYISPRLDLARMQDPLTGGPLIPARLDESLRKIWRSVVTDGVIDRAPSAQATGNGALANQRAEHRFLHFKSPDDWLDYARDFGRGDPIAAIFQHIKGMAGDIANMEILGPNPGATVEWLKQVVSSEHAKSMVGDPSLFHDKTFSIGAKSEFGGKAAQRIEDLYGFIRGRRTISQSVSTFTGDVRNLITSAALGSAVITAAATDVAVDAAARRAIGIGAGNLLGSNAKVWADTVSTMMSGLPIMRQVSRVIDAMTGAPRDQALRSGLIMEEFLHIAGDEARYAGTLGGHTWSRWLADRTVSLTGLAPMTEARRSVFALDFQSHLADMTGKTFDQLPQQLRAKMEGYGFDAAQWDTMRAVAPHIPQKGSAGWLRPLDIAATDRAVAERYLEMILGETERAVPTGTARSKSFAIGAGPKGSFATELLESFTQFKSFSMSLTTLQLETVAQEGGFTSGKGIGYAAALMIPLTIGGIVATQLKQIANGKDPQKMSTATVLQGMATGGGFGIFGDFLLADVNRMGYSLGEQAAGPTIGLVTDLFKLTVGNARQAILGKDTNFGREAVQFAGRYMPIVSSAWQARLAWKRLVLDQLQYQVDPNAHRRWREEERKALREHGQGYWWRPGEPVPDRAPQLVAP
ncbi:hypothetical protein [Tardiphaga sp.]|uniref:hypothetical protein n=1 Tax=Tardiphaga sp. TaxID=1926292 RepID=UPI0037DA649F